MVLTSEVPESDNVLPYIASKSHITTQPLTWDMKKANMARTVSSSLIAERTFV